MANMSNYLMGKVVDSIRDTSFLALYRSNPSASDTGMEVGSAGYARQKIDFVVKDVGILQNTTSIIFPSIADGYGNVTHVGVRDAQYGGNLLFFKSLSEPFFSERGGSIKIDPGGLKISLD